MENVANGIKEFTCPYCQYYNRIYNRCEFIGSKDNKLRCQCCENYNVKFSCYVFPKK